MYKYWLDITVTVFADSAEEAWELANKAAIEAQCPPVYVESVSEPELWEVPLP